ncbi:hypothetical protein [Streptomyces sp. NPDC004050]
MNEDDNGGGQQLPRGRQTLGCITALAVVLAGLFGFAWVFFNYSGYWPGSPVTPSSAAATTPSPVSTPRLVLQRCLP